MKLCNFWRLTLLLAMIFPITLASAVLHSLPIPVNSIELDRAQQIHAVVVDGNMQIALRQASPQANFYSINPGNIFTVAARVVNDTLYLKTVPIITTQKPHPLTVYSSLPPQVVVGINRLHQLVVNGSSSVLASGLIAPDLQVLITGNSQIHLNGMIGLWDLTTIGITGVEIHGINTRELHVMNRGNTVMDLTGRVGVLQMRVGGLSHIDARGLRSNTAFVQTDNQAQLSISVMQQLRAFATDQSFILLYSRPMNKIESTSGSGNILSVSH